MTKCAFLRRQEFNCNQQRPKCISEWNDCSWAIQAKSWFDSADSEILKTKLRKRIQDQQFASFFRNRVGLLMLVARVRSRNNSNAERQGFEKLEGRGTWLISNDLSIVREAGAGAALDSEEFAYILSISYWPRETQSPRRLPVLIICHRLLS